MKTKNKNKTWNKYQSKEDAIAVILHCRMSDRPIRSMQIMQIMHIDSPGNIYEVNSCASDFFERSKLIQRN